jgi:DNA-binding CsgD family transcriptional regulator/DNA-binding SARP family transcriptional activator
MASLISRYFGYDAAADFIKDPAGVSSDPQAFMTRFKTTVKHQIGNIQIKLFGSFSLTIDGKQVDREVFKTRKISAIFRHILASPGQTFSHENLAADFWPDSDEKAASNSLRAALFELRKALAALDMAFDSDNALIAEDAGGFSVCRPESLDSDAARFVALYDRLREGNLTEENEKAALYELTELYDGDYLEDSASNSQAVTRAYYKTIFAEAARRLTDIYTAEGNTDLVRELMLKQLKMTTAALTKEEIKVANLLLDGVTFRDIARKLNLNAAEVEQYESSIRHKLNLMGDNDPNIASAVAQYDLTKRETDMLKFLRDGASTEDIADELYISAETVRTHISRLLRKLGIKSRQDVAQWLEKTSEG